MSTKNRRLFVATHNPDKLREIRSIIAGTAWEVLGFDQVKQYPEPIEDGDTLLQNALKKAREGFKRTGMVSLADDTGLEVDALDGRPGVYSSRYAGENVSYADNVKLLLRELTSVPHEKRTARFRTVMALVNENSEQWWEGIAEGVIIEEPNGFNGFGYDPVFWSPELDKTFAEATEAEKNTVSHRARALRDLKNILEELDREV